MRKAKDTVTLPLFPIEDYASEIIAGIDEAGRGPKRCRGSCDS